jgi:hypothetical protein
MLRRAQGLNGEKCGREEVRSSDVGVMREERCGLGLAGEQDIKWGGDRKDRKSS